jgi:SAM-dependent methyltransferase
VSDLTPIPASAPRTGTDTMSSAMLEIPQYYRWMFSQFDRWLGDTVLDVGTGPGIHLPGLDGRRVIVADLSQDCLDDVRRRFPRVEAVRADIAEPAFAELMAGRGIDTITCLNVLEHIPDDAGALAGFRRILADGRGRLILVVPAHQALYGDMDRLADHRRRYSLRGLTGLLEAAGFEILHARHFNPVGGLAWFVNARLLPVRDLSAPVVNGQIRLFAMMLPAVRAADWLGCRVLRLPFGQSLIAVARPRA